MVNSNKSPPFNLKSTKTPATPFASDAFALIPTLVSLEDWVLFNEDSIKIGALFDTFKLQVSVMTPNKSLTSISIVNSPCDEDSQIIGIVQMSS